MILFISAYDRSLDSRMNSRFGRAPWFIRYDTSNENWKAIENNGPEQPGGAGIATAQLLINQGAEGVISGRFGPNAKQALSTASIKMFTNDDDQLTVAEVVQRYQTDQLPEVH